MFHVKQSSESLKGNPWKLYVLRLLGDFWLIAPILIPLYQSSGLNDTEVFVIQAFYSLMVLALEIPSGYFADRFGRKSSLVLGAVFWVLGFGIYSVADSFWMFLCAEGVLAASAGFRSGSDSALMYDSLICLKREGEYKRFQGFSDAFARVGTAISSLLGGTLAIVTLRLPVVVNMGIAILMLSISILLTEAPRKTPDSKSAWKSIRDTLRYCFRHPVIWPVVLTNAWVFSAGLIGIWSYFLIYQKAKLSLFWIGAVYAVYQAGSAFGSTISHRLEKSWGKKITLGLLLLIPVNFVLIGLIPFPWSLGLIFLNGWLWNMTGPILLDLIQGRVESENRATAISFNNMLSNLWFVVFSVGFGKLSDWVGLHPALMIWGGVIALGLLPALIILERGLRRGE